MRIFLVLLALVSPSLSTPALAEEPAIKAARATRMGELWRIEVTLRHPDTGWEHYADGWEVLTTDGTSLGLRVLAHPHETEQPFTRSLDGVMISDGTDHVLIRARCLQDGWGDAGFELTLPR